MEQVLEVKLLPPVLPTALVERPRLEHLFGEVLARRLTLLVGPSGFGKSTLLATWASQHRCAWYTLTTEDRDVGTLFRGVSGALRLRVSGLAERLGAAAAPDLAHGPDAATEEGARAEAYASFLAWLLDEHLPSDLVLVLDDVHELDPGSPAGRFVEGLCRQAPPRLHLVFASRAEPPFPIGRLRAQGQVLEITGAELAFFEEETEELLVRVAGEEVRPTVATLHATTRGWPAAIRVAAEAVRGRSDPAPAAVVAAARTSEAVFDILAEEVFERADPEVKELVRMMAPIERFTAGLCEALGVDDATRTLALLEQRGLFLVPHGGQEGWFSLHPLLREFARTHLAHEPDEIRRINLAAARWLENAGQFREALGQLTAAGADPEIADLLRDRGAAIVAAGGAEEVMRRASALPASLRSPHIDQLEGEARHALGDWQGAVDCFSRLEVHGEPLPAGAAWRMGMIHHLRGDLDAAVGLYESGMAAPGDDAELALVLAFAAAAWWLRGELDACRKLASDAYALAQTARDDRALAAAHTALAMLAALEGDRRANDAHYLRALDHAQRAGDPLQLIRIHNNRGSRFLEEGYYHDALAELDAAIHTADLAGFATFRALALTNRGQVLLQLGRLEEATRDLSAARTEYERVGARMLAYPLAYLGDVHRARGEMALARAAYEEAIALAEPVGDLQGLVPALSGLAHAVVDDDPELAARLAERAVAVGPALGRPRAMLAAGWIALRRGEHGDAARRAHEAAEAARQHRDRASIAEALELSAVASGDAGDQRSRLEEARALWRSLACPLGEARVELALARVSSDGDAPTLAASAERRFRRLGARMDVAAAAELRAALQDEVKQPVALHVLGGFRVLRDGVLLGPGEWQSRKTRDLLKIIVARRGGPVRRESLLELLWPDDDPSRSASKLSVALSTARSILDPEKRFPADHFLVADRATVALDLTHVSVDVETFLAGATDGLRLLDAGRGDDAREVLASAESAYTGDVLDEDVYEDWTVGLREEARATYVDVARALAECEAATGDHDAAARLLLRILERDPYDERAHLALVSNLVAGRRHGDAHRMFRSYCTRMGEIGVEPATFPAAEVADPELRRR